ncbi:SapC family protein [Endozoicomonas sp. G2_1]|uniref:SapC family protein n=1 Tax=Endozoicomonas sp. G2_1 TaxID=2821091 RepID=UPI001ADCCC36|nr:SapC family protein [Endozoicomonas sp. G2_1]MBO9491323.1 SapC family protein [Endozoicomonas sp. G2_1]
MANLVPVKKEQHQNLKISAHRNLEHLADQHIAGAGAGEFAQLATSFPLFFVKDDTSNAIRSVAMMGLETGENLYLQGDKWLSPYVPQNASMIPFGLGLDPEKEKTLTTCVDIDSEFVGEDKELALFDEEGNETEFLKSIQDSLGRLYDGEILTGKFIKELDENNLLQELELIVVHADGAQKKLVGIYGINEKAMLDLPDEKVLDFQKRGLFIPIYAMLTSLGQVNRLVQLRNEYGEVKLQGIQVKPVEAEQAANEQ